MAIPFKGSCCIVVDGTAYRWRIRHKPTRMQADYGCSSPLTFAVPSESTRGGTFAIQWQPQVDS